MKISSVKDNLKEVAVLLEIYNELSPEKPEGSSNLDAEIRKEVAREQLLRAIVETRKSISVMEKDHD